MNTSCRVCGGSGVIRCADVYKHPGGQSRPIWELAAVVACGCKYREES
jgi:hypothetical protein